MKCSSITPIVVSLLTPALLGQVAEVELDVSTPAISKSIRGSIYPLIWQATIDKENITIPLSEVSAYGVQEYAVGTTTYVRELTITLKSRSVIRAYYLTNRLKDEFDQSRTVEILTRAHKRLSGQKVNPVYKIMPETTHKQVLEYRVENKASVDTLYQSLHKTYIKYLIKDLVPSQRQDAIASIKIETGKEDEEVELEGAE